MAVDFECLIIGGGPAGLTAAIYLARFHLSILVLEDGRSRAAMIPRTHNHAGYPEGIEGMELLRRMRDQVLKHGAKIMTARAIDLQTMDEGFEVRAGVRLVTARKVLLATGVFNRRLAAAEAIHDEALQRGLLRYCPICDGFEMTDRNIAIAGAGDHALREAEFLRSFSPRVTLIAEDGNHRLEASDRRRAESWGIHLAEGAIENVAIDGSRIAIAHGARTSDFDTLYVGLGSDVRSELAVSAGAKTSGDGGILVDRHQQTSIKGLYAAGDVVLGLDQISNAMGQAGVAATAMRNALCEETPLRRGAPLTITAEA
jgi:thioredoxin reductase (NADPH)